MVSKLDQTVEGPKSKVSDNMKANF